MFREYDRGRSGHKLIIEYRRIKQRYLHYLCLYALFTINNIKEGGRNYEIVYDTDVEDFLEGFLDELATPYKTINDCIDAANRKVLEDSNNTEELSYYRRGDGNQYLH